MKARTFLHGYLPVLVNQSVIKLFLFRWTINSAEVIVQSRLVSLMIDQITNLKSKGVDAAIMSSNASFGESKRTLLATNNSISKNKLLYCSPEALQ